MILSRTKLLSIPCLKLPQRSSKTKSTQSRQRWFLRFGADEEVEEDETAIKSRTMSSSQEDITSLTEELSPFTTLFADFEQEAQEVFIKDVMEAAHKEADRLP